MVQMARLGIALQPIATALFANSPFRDGKPTGFLSWRSHVWTDTVSAGATIIRSAISCPAQQRWLQMRHYTACAISHDNVAVRPAQLCCSNFSGLQQYHLRLCCQVVSRACCCRVQDPDRCGILPFVFDDDFGFARYAEFALDVPMYFVNR